jgi:hypothetical protein
MAYLAEPDGICIQIYGRRAACGGAGSSRKTSV